MRTRPVSTAGSTLDNSWAPPAVLARVTALLLQQALVQVMQQAQQAHAASDQLAQLDMVQFQSLVQCRPSQPTSVPQAPAPPMRTLPTPTVQRLENLQLQAPSALPMLHTLTTRVPSTPATQWMHGAAAECALGSPTSSSNAHEALSAHAPWLGSTSFPAFSNQHHEATEMDLLVNPPRLSSTQSAFRHLPMEG